MHRDGVQVNKHGKKERSRPLASHLNQIRLGKLRILILKIKLKLYGIKNTAHNLEPSDHKSSSSLKSTARYLH